MMQEATKKAKRPKEYSILAAIPNAASTQRFLQEVENVVGKESVSFAPNLARLREAIRGLRPQVILLDDRIFGSDSLAASVSDFSREHATILLAPYDREPEVAGLVASGDLEFVPRSGEWQQLAASLIERRLRWAQASRSPQGLLRDRNMGELFRHEINNPLTGILGNAELILAHSDHLPAIDTQRIRTVVELAVRLRETIRRVSNAWEDQSGSVKSA